MVSQLVVTRCLEERGTHVVVRLVRQVGHDAQESLEHRTARLGVRRPWLEECRVLDDDEDPSQTLWAVLKTTLWSAQQPLQTPDDGKTQLWRQRCQQLVELNDFTEVDT